MVTSALVIALVRFEKDQNDDPIETRLGVYNFVELPRVDEQISIFDEDMTKYLVVKRVTHYAIARADKDRPKFSFSRDVASVTIFAEQRWAE